MQSIRELAEKILYHKKLYYQGTPEISDAEYDKLEKELRSLSPDHPALSFVGTEVDKNKDKVHHAHPMLSLAKTYELDSLLTWADEEELIATLKIDGVSLSLCYEHGNLSLAKTRGNGQYGEDVSEKAKWVDDCKKQIQLSILGKNFPTSFEIRGELHCDEEHFFKLAQEMEKLGLDKPTNPRNIIAGVLGRKQHFHLSRFFNFFAFDLLTTQGKSPFAKEAEKYIWLEKHGFKLPPHQLVKNKKEIEDFLYQAQNETDEIGIDGVVFTYNDTSLHEKLGATAHHPRYKMSFKWAGETGKTVIKEIQWATSRLGVVTPVAVVEPIELSGATIQNITFHNASFVQFYNLKIADEIEIIRSGEVIPKFLQVTKSAEGEYSLPKKCPSCGSILDSDEVRLICRSKQECPAQKIGTILHWIRTCEIKDLSEKRLQAMLDLGIIHSIEDLYKLTEQDFLKLPLTKIKMAQKLLANISQSKSLPLARFLAGLGIEGTGVRVWESLQKHFPTLEKILSAKIEEINSIHGFAEKSSQQIVEGLASKKNLINNILNVGVVPIADLLPLHEASNYPEISGKKFVITGKLSKPRNEIALKIKSGGGSIMDSVSKEVYAIITEDPTSDSSKAKKARELGIPFWSEETLWGKFL